MAFPTTLLGYFVLFFFFLSCTQRQVSPDRSFYSEEKVKKEYLKLIADTVNNNLESIHIILDSAKSNPDQSLIEFFPNIEFWLLTIRNPSHYEYNLGNIPVVVAFSKLDSNDVRFLLPFSYSESSKDFFDIFYNVSIDDKEKCVKSITRLFLQARVFFLGCDKTIYDLNQSSTNADNEYIITTSWQEKCRDIFPETKPAYTDSITKKTLYHFKRNRITKIDYQEWIDLRKKV